jgi:methylenetetrahydrofolate--tRNA-(uracil-5-)-methyltransferase
LRFAGQLTGCEGYVESAAVGLIAGRLAAAERLGLALAPPPPETAHGALLAHITGGHVSDGAGSFQPMNINFGLFPPLEAMEETDLNGRRLKAAERTSLKRRTMAERALDRLKAWATVSGDLATVAA